MKEIKYEDVLSCLLPVSSVTIVVENMCRICTTTTAAAATATGKHTNIGEY
jgi:hypothetical protein